MLAWIATTVRNADRAASLQHQQIGTPAPPKMLVKSAAADHFVAVVNTLCSTERATQLAVSLVNQPGKLAQVCNALAKAEINIRALTVLETWGENSILRAVVSDAAKAMACLQEAGVSAMETEVLMIETENRPGALAQLAEQLGRAGVNIEYAYLAATAHAEQACIIVRPSDIDKAEQILAQ